MATSPLGGFADISRYVAAARQPQGSPLDSLIQGFQQGQAIQKLPETIAQDALSKQLAVAIQKANLAKLQRPQIFETGGALFVEDPNSPNGFKIIQPPKNPNAVSSQFVGISPDANGTPSAILFNPSEGTLKSTPLPTGVTSIAPKVAPAAGSGSEMALTPETTSMLAQRFISTGEIPGMGMGKAATAARSAVLNEVQNIMSKSSTSPEDQLFKQAAYKASKAELGRLQGQRGLIMAFSNTATKNLDIAQELSDRVDRAEVPVFDRWLLAGRKAIAGDPDVAAFEAATRVAVNEAARVITTATGGGVTSDAARAEVESILNSAQTPDQFRAVADILRKDIENRKGGYEDQIQQIKQSISPGSAKSSPNTSQTSEMVKVINAQGKRGEIPKDKLAAALKAGYKQVQ